MLKYIAGTCCSKYCWQQLLLQYLDLVSSTIDSLLRFSTSSQFKTWLAAEPAQADLIRDLVKGYVRPVKLHVCHLFTVILALYAPLAASFTMALSSCLNTKLLLARVLRGAELIMRRDTILQEVAADQAIMQLMDARGTLMELKVNLSNDAASMSAAPSATKTL